MSARVLIIEDDQSIAELVRDYLEIEGLEPEIVADGSQGLERGLADEWACIVLDIMLPGMDGFAICRELRKTSDVPILVLSARRDDYDKIRGLGLGADDYMVKPFSPGELVARVKAHMERHRRLTAGPATSANRSEPVIELGTLTVDPNSRTASRSGAEITLTAKEYEILSLLARNPGRLFSREELYDRVWGEETAGDVSTVTVHIRKLREKVELDPSDPRLIRTVWGMGYRLVV